MAHHHQQSKPVRCHIKTNEIALKKLESIITYATCIIDTHESAGDIQIYNRDDELVFLFERKTCSDLINSMKNRNESQKAQMEKTPTRIKKGYIIEMDKVWSQPTERRQIDGYLQNRMIQDDYIVAYSKNPQHTMEWLNDICRKCDKYCDEQINKPAKVVGAVIRKKDIMEPLVFAHWLEHLRGISKHAASRIALECESPCKLIERYNACKTKDEARWLLQGIVIGMGKTGKERRAGKGISETIYNAFHTTYTMS